MKALLRNVLNGLAGLACALCCAIPFLLAAGVVASTWSQGEGRRRRTYRLTAQGAKALAEQRRSWHQFSGAVSAILTGRATKGTAAGQAG
jgi:PadR family transcriptional regulator